MSERVSIRGIPRVKFVKGYTGTDPEDGSVKCGAGTRFAVKVTLDELEQVHYRVEQARWVSGWAETQTVDSYYNRAEVYSAAPPSQLVSVAGTLPGGAHRYLLARGYFANDVNQPTSEDPEPFPDPPMEDYGTLFGTAYQLSINARDPYNEDLFLPFDSNYFASGTFQDIADSEYAMWATIHFGDPDANEKLGWFGSLRDFGWNGQDVSINFPDENYRTAFTFVNYGVDFSDGTSTLTPLVHGIYNLDVDPETGDTYRDCRAYLQVGQRVAFVDLTGSGNPLDPGNELYLEVRFFFIGKSLYSGLGIDLASFLGDEGFVFTDTPLGHNLILRLAESDLTIPLYYNSYADGDPVTLTATDFVIEAVKFFKYKTRSGALAWNETTGEPENGGYAA